MSDQTPAFSADSAFFLAWETPVQRTSQSTLLDLPDVEVVVFIGTLVLNTGGGLNWRPGLFGMIMGG